MKSILRRIEEKTKYRFAAITACICMILIPRAVYADSSWIWLTDYRPFDILPPVALATIVIEVLAIWLIPQTGKFFKTAAAVCAANAVSFLLPYALLLGNQVYPKFNDVLDAGPNYIVGAVFVLLTLALEIPVVYNILKKDVRNEKVLLWTIIASNIATTVIVAVIERMVTNGCWI